MDSSEHDDASEIEVETVSCGDGHYSRMHNSENDGQHSRMQNIETDGQYTRMQNSETTRKSAMVDENIEERDSINSPRPAKRNRLTDLDEVWTTVNRRGKRIARSYEGNETLRIPDDKIEVNITSTSDEKLPKQFKLSKILKMENIYGITRVKYINSYKVILQFSNETDADRLLESNYFKEKGYKCRRTLDIQETYGVIKNIDLDSTEEEILESLRSDLQIIGAKRLKRRNSGNGQWEPSEVIRICFKGSMLPTKVYIFDTVSTVTPYEFPVTQCAVDMGTKLNFVLQTK